MRIISWNIDSLNAALTSDSARALLTRETLNTIVGYDADIIAIQETKLPRTGPTKKHLDILAENLPDYEMVYRLSEEPARKSYAGTMFLYKNTLNPIVTYPEIGAPDTMDVEGRMITMEFDDCYVTQVYTPNAGSELVRLAERQLWDEKYREYLTTLDQEKIVIATGDFNVAHREIDLANQAVIIYQLDLQMKSVQVSLYYWTLDLRIHSVTSMGMLRENIRGGINERRQVKSTTLGGELITSW